LDWLNFSLAALLTGSGPFVAVKLADRGWMASDIGLILTAGGLASLFTQVPAGELIDMSRSKRALLGLATGAVILGVLVFGLRPDFPPSSARLSSRAWPLKQCNWRYVPTRLRRITLILERSGHQGPHCFRHIENQRGRNLHMHMYVMQELELLKQKSFSLWCPSLE
jgi:hypothetical protein